jgi:hypothetical protein
MSIVNPLPARQSCSGLRLYERSRSEPPSFNSILAKAFRGRLGALVRALLAEAQFDPELAKAFRENWTLPRRRLVWAVLQKTIKQGEVRSDIDVEATIDALYAPIYYRLQMGTGPISEAYVDRVFEQAMDGMRRRKI